MRTLFGYFVRRQSSDRKIDCYESGDDHRHGYQAEANVQLWRYYRGQVEEKAVYDSVSNGNAWDDIKHPAIPCVQVARPQNL
jgi:hypothetical protein